MERFYWLVEGHLAGCSRPGGRDAGRPTLESDLHSLRERGITGVLTLTEEALPADVLAHCGLASLHLPVPDMQALLPDEIMSALHFIDSVLQTGGAVGVHCLMGQGRTANVLGAYLIRGGMDSESAVRELRAICPGALSAESQVRSLRIFAADRYWIV